MKIWSNWRIYDVQGTLLDFRKFHKIGARIEQNNSILTDMIIALHYVIKMGNGFSCNCERTKIRSHDEDLYDQIGQFIQEILDW